MRSLATLPAMLSPDGWLATHLSGTEVVGLQLWQWLALGLLVGLSAAVAWTVAPRLLRLARRGSGGEAAGMRDGLVRTLSGPFRLFVWIGLIWAGARLLRLDEGEQRALGNVAFVIGIVAAGWFALRLVDWIAGSTHDTLLRRGEVGLGGLVPVATRVAKGVVLFLAVLILLQNMGVDLTSVIAGLGIGGLAVALAAQKSIENLFGGIMLFVDRPVRVGDFCRFGDQVGTIEEIGLRSTRIRTLDRTVVTFPNSQFAALPLENFTRRDRIRFFTTLGVRYETSPDQLRLILIEVRKMLLAHPKVTPAPARIRFVGFGAYSLDLEIFAYVDTSDFDEFLAVREDLLLRIMDIVTDAGSGFAFPSQTIYAGRDDGLDHEHTREAEARVRTWREAGRLWLPDVPAGERPGVENTLEYPERGSATYGVGAGVRRS